MERDNKGLKLRNLAGLTGSLEIDVDSTKDELLARMLLPPSIWSMLQSKQLNLAAVAAALN